VGIALWVACGTLAFLLARIIPAGRSKAWVADLAAALVIAIVLGVVATALDFGGWKELDWRAGLFTFLGAFSASGLVRGVTMRQ
jgi:hypothetical protein